MASRNGEPSSDQSQKDMDQKDPDIGQSQVAPLIQISHLHVISRQSDGIQNDGFGMDDKDEGGSRYSISRPVSPVSHVSEADGEVTSRSSSRRNSHQPVTTATKQLVVPEHKKDRRRQSLGSNISNEADVFTFDVANNDPWSGSQGTGAMATLGVEHVLSPRSPGGKSMRSEWSELAQLERSDSIGSFHSVESFSDPSFGYETSNTHSAISSQMSARIKDLVRKFNSRTERFKEKAIQPPSPSSTCSLDGKSVFSAVSGNELEQPGRQHRLDSFIPISSRASGAESAVPEEVFIGFGRYRCKLPSVLEKCRFPDTIDPTRKPYIIWLFLLTVAFMYNAVSIPLRAAFYTAQFFEPVISYKNMTESVCDVINSTSQSSNVSEITCTNVTSIVAVKTYKYYPGYQTEDNRLYWWILDYISDLMYIVDIIIVKGRLRFVNNGLLEKDRKVTSQNYRAKVDFKLDIFSLTPLDLLYLIPALKFNSLVRLPRLLKLKTFWEFYDRVDRMVSSAHIVRVMRTLTYMLFLIHVEACGYYAMSAYEGLRKNDWVYSGEGIAYIRCMYLATKTATSIGNNPRPENIPEYLFMTVYWLSGVFVFAMLIGQIRDIFQSAGMAKEQYRKTMDSTLFYMKSLNLPRDLQDRVRTWFNYNWETSKTLDENSLVSGLPKKMKADLAIHVHFQTLSKVHLFQDCDKNLLFDLVLKLKPSLYLKGDYICRKGEVGTEMYIVMSGQVEVVGGENNSVVFATLHEGSAFGEISLLALTGGNRRTADVRSKGFSQLFILKKNDFEEAMRDYPAAAKILKKRAKRLLAQNAKHTKASKKAQDNEIIKSRHGTPKLLKTVVQAIGANSHIHDYLGSHPENGDRKTLASRATKASEFADDSSLSSSSASSCSGASDELEDEELLVIEEIERKLTPAELAQIYEEDNIDLLPKSPNKSLTYDIKLTKVSDTRPSSRPESCSTVKSGIEYILATPTKDRASTIENIGNNKVVPASIMYEDDRTATPTKKSLQAPTSPVINKANSAVKGGKDAKDALNKRTASAVKSGARPRHNKVAPSNDEPSSKDTSKTPDLSVTNDNISLRHRQQSHCMTGTNTVTCEVEVHHRKTSIGTSQPKGIDNKAYITDEKPDTTWNSETKV